jgi:ABC-type nickel/cobalt efflux system permease component RcnA
MAARDTVQHFGQTALHPRALARGHHHHIQRCCKFRHETTSSCSWRPASATPAKFSLRWIISLVAGLALLLGLGGCSA